jgi:hypothetical protein
MNGITRNSSLSLSNAYKRLHKNGELVRDIILRSTHTILRCDDDCNTAYFSMRFRAISSPVSSFVMAFTWQNGGRKSTKQCICMHNEAAGMSKQSPAQPPNSPTSASSGDVDSDSGAL